MSGAIEAVMAEPGALHQIGNAAAVEATLAEQLGCLVQNPLPASRLNAPAGSPVGTL
jgi:hypothetical protein